MSTQLHINTLRAQLAGQVGHVGLLGHVDAHVVGLRWLAFDPTPKTSNPDAAAWLGACQVEAQADDGNLFNPCILVDRLSMAGITGIRCASDQDYNPFNYNRINSPRRNRLA